MKCSILLAMALGVMVIGCKKAQEESKNGSGICRLKSVSEDAVSSGTTFEYGPDGKIIRETYEDGSYATFTVESGQLVVRSYTSTGQLKPDYEKKIHTLNSQGYIGKTVDIHPGDTDTYIYTYSPEGHKIKEEVFDYKGKWESTSNYTVVDGNRVMKDYISSHDNDTSTEVYSFLQAENTAGIGMYPFGHDGLEQYYGKVNKNLVNTVAISYGSTSLSFYYEMDGDRVKYLAISQPGFPNTMKFWYTYENCKK